MSPESKVAAPVGGIADTIRTLATLVRLHEGNRDPEVNNLLERAEVCACTADAMVATLKRTRAELASLPRSLAYDITHLPRIDAVLSRATGAAS